ncbi:MAG: hypothetical protein ACJ790_18405, partial [Myxococcaceae bacterium]
GEAAKKFRPVGAVVGAAVGEAELLSAVLEERRRPVEVKVARLDFREVPEGLNDGAALGADQFGETEFELIVGDGGKVRSVHSSLVARRFSRALALR